MDVIRKLPVPPLRKLSTQKLFDPENRDVNPLTDAELRQAAESGGVPEVFARLTRTHDEFRSRTTYAETGNARGERGACAQARHGRGEESVSLGVVGLGEIAQHIVDEQYEAVSHRNRRMKHLRRTGTPATPAQGVGLLVKKPETASLVRALAIVEKAASVELKRLQDALRAAGARGNALQYSEALLEKINLLEAMGGYGQMLDELLRSRNAAEVRGRLLEVNFAAVFARHGVPLVYGARQGRTGDIDFMMPLGELEVFFELKLHGIAAADRQQIDAQLEESGTFAIGTLDDSPSVARLEQDILTKGTPRKFNPTASTNHVNLVAIDVSEVLYGTVDLGDCLLAALGNRGAAQYLSDEMRRPGIVGVFEREQPDRTPEELEWIRRCHHLVPPCAPHVRDYIHGVLFLFRDPKETAALSYSLAAHIVWNDGIIDRDRALLVQSAMPQGLLADPSSLKDRPI